MGISNVIRTKVVFLLSMIILSLFIGSSLGEHSRLLAISSDSNGARLLMIRKLGFDKTKLRYYRERVKLLDVGLMKLAPGGPNPQHHEKSPPLRYYQERATLLDTEPMRLAPDGPNPQHHKKSPPLGYYPEMAKLLDVEPMGLALNGPDPQQHEKSPPSP